MVGAPIRDELERGYRCLLPFPVLAGGFCCVAPRRAGWGTGGMPPYDACMVGRDKLIIASSKGAPARAAR